MASQKKMQREQVSYHCKKCKDQGFVIKEEFGYEVAKKCECKLRQEIKEKAEGSGLGDLIRNKTLDNYIATKEFQKVIKEKAIKFINEFLKGNENSFSLLGQSGIGKTHIMSAVARKLIARNYQVKYFTADEIIQKLQSCKFDEENYNREFSEIANARVLYIDELFKSSIQNYYGKESINNNDFREIFKIINYRYNKKKPILLNSEIHFERFADLDQAMIGRINEMCDREFLISIKPDKSKNYRL